MKKSLTLLIFFVFSFGVAKAQLATDDLRQMKLPPLEKLFEGAMSSAMVQFYELRMEGERLTLKSEKRRWLEYFNIFGTYQYGVIGLNSYTNLGSDYPIVYQNSAGNQLWYNGGVSLILPLGKIFDRGNSIRRQKLKIDETTKEMEMWYNEQKIKIVELYVKVDEMLNTISLVIEQNLLAQAQYDVAQKDYIMGKINAQELNSAKGTEVQSKIQLERVRSELNTSLMKLEILSNTKILNK